MKPSGLVSPVFLAKHVLLIAVVILANDHING
jgi:hypothetical protein